MEREAFLARVRAGQLDPALPAAVGTPGPLVWTPESGDLLERFIANLEAVDGVSHRVNRADAIPIVVEVLMQYGVRRALAWGDDELPMPGIRAAMSDRNIEIVGCSPENSNVMIQSLGFGELRGDLPSKPTLSDGTAGGIESESITFEMCQRYIDRTVNVSEKEIAANLADFMDVHHMQIEGAAAVPVAAFLKAGEKYKNKSVVLIICGANIGVKTLREVLGKQC